MHNHNECSCNSHKDHDHEHGCCCGGHHHHPAEATIAKLTAGESGFIELLKSHKFLPVVQFVVKSTKEHSFESVALSPVFIGSTDETLEMVKKFGAIIKGLEDKGYITIDFDLPLQNYSYNEYHNSDVFAYFKSTVAEGKDGENFLGDIATIECGSIAMTEELAEQFED